MPPGTSSNGGRYSGQRGGSYPDPSNIVKQEEPFVDVHLYTPNDDVGGLMDLCQNKRGVLIDMK